MDLRKQLAEWIGGKTPKPITGVKGGGSEERYDRWNAKDATDPRAKIDKWITQYKKGGLYADLADAYPLFVLANGYKLACEKGAEGLKDKVQAWMDQPHVDFDSVIWDGTISAILGGDSYQELILTKLGQEPWGIVTRDPSTFRKKWDEKGKIEGYLQYTKTGYMEFGDKGVEIEPERIINLILFKSPGSMYGLSIWERAEDDTQRDCDVIESVSKAIHRHGTPKQQWDVGTPENPANEAELKEVEKEIEKMGPKTDFATSNVKINSLDTTGVSNVDVYSNVSLQRVACAFGVPEEMAGLGRGSTEATANVRMDTFLKKIATIQNIVARTYSREVIDRITGQPGMVWMEFNSPPKDLLKIAQTLQALGNTDVSNPFAILSPDEMRAEIGKEPRDEGEIESIPEERETPEGVPA